MLTEATGGSPFGQHVLRLEAPLESEELPFYEYLFEDEYGDTMWPQLRFQLMWTEYGGSGLGMQFSEVEDLDIADAMGLIELLFDQRSKERDAIKGAGQKS